MPKGQFDLDEMLQGGGEEDAWLHLLVQPDAAQEWEKARIRRSTLDAVAEAIRDQTWLARRLLAFGRARRRTAVSSPISPALTMHQPELAALLRGSSPRRSETVSWGRRGIRRTRLGEVLHVSCTSRTSIWYATRAGEGVLAGVGWRVEDGDLPLLMVATDAQGDTMEECLQAATKVAGCLFLGEGENDR